MRVRMKTDVLETAFSAWLGVLLLLLVADASRRLSRGTFGGVVAARAAFALVSIVGRVADWTAGPTDASTLRDRSRAQV